MEKPCRGLLRRVRAAMRRAVLALAAVVICVEAQQEPPPAVGVAPRQPIPFSHRTHVGLNLKCAECHPGAGENRAAGMPRESLCMNCHVAVKADSAAIIKLAGFVKRKEPAPWARLYRLPDFVSFSHKRHVGKAGVACATCHGEVKNQDVLAKEKSIGMQSCMACHDQRKANNNCDACHAIHPA
jgi:Cytochrome c7 and related cytochrome c